MRLIRGSVQPGEEKATSRVFEAAQGLLGGKHICGGPLTSLFLYCQAFSTRLGDARREMPATGAPAIDETSERRYHPPERCVAARLSLIKP